MKDLLRYLSRCPLSTDSLTFSSAPLVRLREA
jgi:hypothetical protein